MVPGYPRAGPVGAALGCEVTSLAGDGLRNIARALGGPTSVALVSVAIMAFGLAAVFGGGWAAIAVGGVGIVAAVRMASARHR